MVVTHTGERERIKTLKWVIFHPFELKESIFKRMYLGLMSCDVTYKKGSFIPFKGS